ncbi:hypothetical protein QBC40DRAFT_268862 [Triangularia verruculosa]|uniref:Nuclear pore complex protein Nup85 n=1 Tax=Triangularia verruculosa TaxID=2587418 RepID=A0AAN7AQU5_9PEZI|nr:hypothetical protein QBC40DRAFT_268862 [Triangularia verruculosa]
MSGSGFRLPDSSPPSTPGRDNGSKKPNTNFSSFGDSMFGESVNDNNFSQFSRFKDQHPEFASSGIDTAGSFTPAGAPSAKYLGSSIMKGLGDSTSDSAPASKGLFTGGPKGLFTSGKDDDKAGKKNDFSLSFGSSIGGDKTPEVKGLFGGGGGGGLFTGGTGKNLFGQEKKETKEQPKPLFGQQPSQDKPPSGLFSQDKPPSSLFSQQPSQEKPPSSLFANTSFANTWQEKPASDIFAKPANPSGLFSQQTTSQESKAPQGSFFANRTSDNLFLAKPQEKPSTSLFSQQPSQEKPPSSLFSHQSSEEKPPSSLFAKPAGGDKPPSSLFSQQPQEKPPSSIFSQQPQESKAPSGLVGNQSQEKPASSLFSQQSEQKPPSSLFSQQSQEKPPSSLFSQQSQEMPPASLFAQPKPQASSSNMFAAPKAQAPAPKPLFGGNAAPKPAPSLGGRNAIGQQHVRKPSKLSRSVMAEEFASEEEDIAEEAEPELPTAKSARFAPTTTTNTGATAPTKSFAVPESDSEDEGDTDMWLDMNARQAASARVGDESDLLMFATPAATERARMDAENIFRATARSSVGPSGFARPKELRFAALAKDAYSQMGTAEINETPQIILNTENLIEKLYDEGIGEDGENPEKLDIVLAEVAGGVAELWRDYANKLPRPYEEHPVEIGPGPHATTFEKANYLANLALRIHHTRYEQGEAEPLPQTMFGWLEEYHDMYGNQADEILNHQPSPACHGLFWQAVFVSLLRGKVGDAVDLLANAGWECVKGVDKKMAYTGKALDNVERAVGELIGVLEGCPGIGGSGDWDIYGAEWELFRVRARGSLELLRRFAEGGGGDQGEFFGDSMGSGEESFGGLARRAESQVPWEIYENLNIVFDIVLGEKSAIMEAAQDWLEATVGLLGWWDESRAKREEHGKGFRGSQLGRSQALVLADHRREDRGTYLERLGRAFHAAVESDFHFNSQNPVELGMACIFEDNVKGVIGLLRGWSLPIASAVAEIASLGKWLPAHRPAGVFGFDDLDMDDLEVLGVDPGSPDDVDGIKDSTLAQYAKALSGFEELSTVAVQGVRRDGWELAIHVLGRMDSAEYSEELMRDLVQGQIDGLGVESSRTVDKLWGLLNELGMIPYAEDTAESFGEILARDSKRYGEAMWYYALAHRPNKVREVMNLLLSYSLIQSCAFPPTSELDNYLVRLLTDRNKTLEDLAARDMESAELLGKMLSGYASLRQFYDIRDNKDSLPAHVAPLARKQQAAAALVSVIASSDDNIRGGLYDQTRDGIVSEDFLLALLGEALVFTTDPSNTNVHFGQAATPVLTLDQIDVILKAIEDLEAVGERVREACEEFLGVVLGSVNGGNNGLAKGGRPEDLLRGGWGGNLMLTAASSRDGGLGKVAKELGKSLGGGKGNDVKRGWDWRVGEGIGKNTGGREVMRRLRLGLAKDVAGLWLDGADEMGW